MKKVRVSSMLTPAPLAIHLHMNPYHNIQEAFACCVCQGGKGSPDYSAMRENIYICVCINICCCVYKHEIVAVLVLSYLSGLGCVTNIIILAVEKFISVAQCIVYISVYNLGCTLCQSFLIICTCINN